MKSVHDFCVHICPTVRITVRNVDAPCIRGEGVQWGFIDSMAVFEPGRRNSGIERTPDAGILGRSERSIFSTILVTRNRMCRKIHPFPTMLRYASDISSGGCRIPWPPCRRMPAQAPAMHINPLGDTPLRHFKGDNQHRFCSSP